VTLESRKPKFEYATSWKPKTLYKRDSYNRVILIDAVSEIKIPTWKGFYFKNLYPNESHI
jgi:hypothetical protein